MMKNKRAADASPLQPAQAPGGQAVMLPSLAPLPFSWLTCGLFAAALPMWVATSVPPTSTFFNQLFAVLGAAVWLIVWGVSPRGCVRGAGRSGPAAGVLVAVLVALAASQLVTTAPLGQRLIPCGVLILAAALCSASACAARAGRLEVFAAPLMAALLAAGVVSTFIGVLQVFAPQLTGNSWVAYPSTPGRAVGNMRQPNQLSTLLLWAMGAAVWLSTSRRWHRGVLTALLALLTLGVMWTSSRTGMLGMGLFMLWGLVDRRLPGWLRLLMLLGLPLLYALGWWGMEQWSASTGHFFYGDDQVKKTLHGDPSSSRGKIWANTLAMIAQHPWTGVGPGAYNFVWSLTPFPDRPVAFFDHSHNAVLQLAVESGVPFAAAVLVALGWAFWRARGGLVQADVQADGVRADGVQVQGMRAAWFLLAVVGVHSLLEYPLWYSYFLLPAAILAGWACSGGAASSGRDAAAAVSAARGPLRRGFTVALGAASIVTSLWATAQYYTVAVIFDPQLSWGEADLLPQRIARGQRSLSFGHHADYAQVTMAEQPAQMLPQFERPAYHLWDTRLMMAYAKALAAAGEVAKAQSVAARLREFRNPASEAFFAACKPSSAPALVGAALPPLPFQCGADPRLPAEALRPRAVVRPQAAPERSTD